jgi:hypothetical protein
VSDSVIPYKQSRLRNKIRRTGTVVAANTRAEIKAKIVTLVAYRTKALVCGRVLAGIVGSNPPGGIDICLLWVFVLSGRGLCDGPIPRPEESYWLWCVSECDKVKINNLYTYCE